MAISPELLNFSISAETPSDTECRNSVCSNPGPINVFMNHPTKSMSKTSSRTPLYLVIVGLAILILSVYWQVGGYSFIGFDADIYDYQNFHVQRGLIKDSVKWAFTTF